MGQLKPRRIKTPTTRSIHPSKPSLSLTQISLLPTHTQLPLNSDIKWSPPLSPSQRKPDAVSSPLHLYFSLTSPPATPSRCSNSSPGKHRARAHPPTPRLKQTVCPWSHLTSRMAGPVSVTIHSSLKATSPRNPPTPWKEFQTPTQTDYAMFWILFSTTVESAIGIPGNKGTLWFMILSLQLWLGSRLKKNRSFSCCIRDFHADFLILLEVQYRSVWSLDNGHFIILDISSILLGAILSTHHAWMIWIDDVSLHEFLCFYYFLSLLTRKPPIACFLCYFEERRREGKYQKVYSEKRKPKCKIRKLASRTCT